jgi:diamine N-acetyltransferase
MKLNWEKATDKDIYKVTELAEVCWNAHYPSIIGQAQVDYMLHKMYDLNSLKKQLEEGHIFLILKNQTDTLGFLSYSVVEKDFFIHKFYILPVFFGQGYGSRFFNKFIEDFKPSSIRLTVNRQNFTSINFYFKNGFTIEKVADFDIGNGFVMNDFVMLWRS